MFAPCLLPCNPAGCSQVCKCEKCLGRVSARCVTGGSFTFRRLPSRTRREGRRHWIPWELRCAITISCISWTAITDLVHALKLLQRQVQIVSSELFHFPCLRWHEAAQWAAVLHTSHATRDKPMIYLLIIQKSPFSVYHWKKSQDQLKNCVSPWSPPLGASELSFWLLNDLLKLSVEFQWLEFQWLHVFVLEEELVFCIKKDCKSFGVKKKTCFMSASHCSLYCAYHTALWGRKS